MKTYSLELTENELKALTHSIIDFWNQFNLLFKEDPKEAYSKNIDLSNSILGKLKKFDHIEPDQLITYKDFFNIKSMAKNEYLDLHNETYLSEKRIEQEEFRNISIANAMIMWLNSKGLIKKQVRFDFTDNSSEFDTSEE